MFGGTSRYEVLDPFGASTLGQRFKARDRELERLVLLWWLPSGLFDDLERRRCLRRAETLAALDHPGLCTLYEARETGDGGILLVFAWSDGETLAERLARGPLKPAVAADLAARIAAGLTCAHGAGLIHGALEPSGLLVTPSGEAKILDLAGTGFGERTVVDQPAAAAGLSPEQHRGAPADARSDVWAVGALLYEMVTGRRPSARAQAVPLRALRPDAPEELERIAARALELHPSGRYASAEELRRDLRSLASTGSFSTPEPPAAARTATQERVAHYRILERLGGGGMGVVYRAEDTRLGRQVALKLLPPELARDPIAKARFLQEARAASAVEHPNLCTLYEAGEAEDGRLYLAMPCYDGETLRARLERGPLPAAEAVDVARQVALGLARAHRQKIVHRDVKPANLMLTRDGVVKILDFGIAKLTGDTRLTRAGAAVGTLGYMAPEQARGAVVDHRADLWALGVVLYEMLGGRRPFRGETDGAVYEAILHREPEPLEKLRQDLPPGLERIVRRLLEKDSDRRYDAAEQVAADLAAPGSTAEALPRPSGRPRFLWLGAGLILVLALLLVLAGGWLVRSRQGTADASPQFTRLTNQEGSELFPSLAPTGDFFAYTKEDGGDLDIFLQRAGGTQAINLTADSPVDDSLPVFSPDGRQIAFRSEREGAGLFLMGATGEDVRRVADAGYNASFSPDGREIAWSTVPVQDPVARQDLGRIWRIDLGTGRQRLVAEEDAVQPSWSPHGERIAFWGLEKGTSRRRIWTVSADGGARVPVTASASIDWNPVWSADGRFLYFVSDRSGSMNLWRVRIDEGTGRVLEPPEAVVIPAAWIGYPSFSRDGRRMIYTTRERRSAIEKVALDPAGWEILGTPVQITRGVRDLAYVSASPDGSWLVFKTSDSPEDLFLIRPDGSGFRQITDDPAKDRSPVWFPDGRVLFASDRSGKYEAWSIRTDGSDLLQLTAIPGQPVLHPISSPDGRRIAFALGYGGAVWVDLGASLERRVLRPLSPSGSAEPLFPYCWSPDGQRLVGAANAGLVLFSFATGRLRRLTAEGIRPICRGDSPDILFIDGKGGLSVLDSRTGTERQILARPDSVTFPSFDLSPDARWLYLLRTREEGDLWIRDAG